MIELAELDVRVQAVLVRITRPLSTLKTLGISDSPVRYTSTRDADVRIALGPVLARPENAGRVIQSQRNHVGRELSFFRPLSFRVRFSSAKFDCAHFSWTH